jgi:site-specific DNA recombinase
MNGLTHPTSKGARCAVYIRVSDPKQEANYSLRTQEEECRAYAATRGWTVIGVWSDVWTADDLFERKGMTDLRAAVRTGQVDVVLAHAIDRWSRNQAHQGLLISEAEYAGARVEFATERLADTPEGRFMQAAKGFAAEIERLKFMERSNRGRLARVASGKPTVGPRAPYGLRWVDDEKSRLIEDPITGPIVQRMFQEVAAGGSARRVALRLTAEGIPTPTGKNVWVRQTILGILRHPVYVGDATALRLEYSRVQIPGEGKKRRAHRRAAEGQVVLPDVAPALVDRETAVAALAQLPLNKKQSVRNNHNPVATLLRAGFARCGYCGRSLGLKTVQGQRYYTCNQQDRHGCPWFGISARLLDSVVWERVEHVLTRPDVIAAEVQRLRDVDPTMDDLAAIQRRLAEIARKQGNLVNRIASEDDNDVASLYRDQLGSLAHQSRQLQTAQRDLMRQREGWQVTQEQLADLEIWCSKVAASIGDLTYEQKRLALNALGVGVRVWKQDHEPRYDVTLSLDIVASSGC